MRGGGVAIVRMVDRICVLLCLYMGGKALELGKDD